MQFMGVSQLFNCILHIGYHGYSDQSVAIQPHMNKLQCIVCCDTYPSWPAGGFNVLVDWNYDANPNPNPNPMLTDC